MQSRNARPREQLKKEKNHKVVLQKLQSFSKWNHRYKEQKLNIADACLRYYEILIYWGFYLKSMVCFKKDIKRLIS